MHVNIYTETSTKQNIIKNKRKLIDKHIYKFISSI